MTEVTSPYSHFLFYKNPRTAQAALVYVQEEYDPSAEVLTGPGGYDYAVAFETSEEFEDDEAMQLVGVTSADEYDLNHYPEDDEDEDLPDEDEDESLDFEDEEDDFPEVFTARERDLAIAQSEDNDWTIEYITRLERIAYTAYVFLVKSCNLPVTLPQASYNIAALSVADLESALHAELAAVNFMD